MDSIPKTDFTPIKKIDKSQETPTIEKTKHLDTLLSKEWLDSYFKLETKKG